MSKLTKTYTLRVSETQSQSLAKLKDYNVDVARFIRDAVREKIQRDWPGIKERKNRVKLPF